MIITLFQLTKMLMHLVSAISARHACPHRRFLAFVIGSVGLSGVFIAGLALSVLDATQATATIFSAVPDASARR